MSQHLDLKFTLTATEPIVADHGYLLYGAISRELPAIHQSNGIAIHPIRGRQVGNRMLAVMPWSNLTLRVPDGRIDEVLPVAGRSLRVGPATLHVGVPRVEALQPTAALRSRLVTIKIQEAPTAADITPELFQIALRRQLDALGVSREVTTTLSNRDERPLRTLRIKQKEVVGYEVILEGLSAAESLAIQEVGLGGRRHMGCGVFVPLT